MKNAIIVDVSRWQPPSRVSYSTFAENGVNALIAKASQGDFYDVSFPIHITEANSAGLITGAYHWVDPGKDVPTQVQTFTSRIKNLPVNFVAADMEQHWVSWAEWYNGKVVKTYDSILLNRVTRAFVEGVQDKTGLPILLYTRKSWVEYWAGGGFDSWMSKYFGWFAYYPYARTRITCTWDELYTKYWPKLTEPARPRFTAGWLIWQFTGDKFTLPGFGGPLDVNMFNGDLDALKRFVGGELPQPSKPAFVVGGGAITNEALRVRSGPGITFSQLARQSKGVLFEVLDVRQASLTGDIWLRIGPNAWVAGYYKGYYLCTPVSGGLGFDYPNYLVRAGKLKARTAPGISAAQAQKDGYPMYYYKGDIVKVKPNRKQEGPYLWAETSDNVFICLKESGSEYATLVKD